MAACVAPWRVAKMEARLQAASTSGKPVLLRQSQKCELGVRVSVLSPFALCDDRTMDRNPDTQWFPALLTAGSFLAMVSTWTLALLDALDDSPWCKPEFAIGSLCALAFVSLMDLRVQIRG
jgi:hypothetical protein